MVKTRVRSLVQICCVVSIVATIWIVPVREVTIAKAVSTNNDIPPLLTAKKELNATQVDIDAFCLVTITITNLSNTTTAYSVNCRDTVFSAWAFAIRGSPTHEWDSLGNRTSVSYSYLLSPKKQGTFQLQRANVTYSTKDGTAVRSALSNEVELFVPPITSPTPVRDMEGLQTILFAEVTILVILIAAILAYRKTPITQPK